MPFFSVILPTHNGADCIGKAIESIASQSFRDFELIVVCDACDDGTHELVMEALQDEDFTFRILDVDYRLDGMARNAGLDVARGEWILFLDDDDWFMHEYVFSMLCDIPGKQGESVINFSYVQKNRGYREQTPDNLFMTCWCRCCRRDLIGNTRFTNAPYGSDLQFYADLMRKKPDMVFWNTPMIYYNANNRSLNEYRRTLKEGDAS